MTGQNFAMIPYRLTKNKLSNLTGSQRGLEIFENVVEREVIKEHTEFQEALSYNEAENATSRQVEEGFVYFKREKKRNLRNQFATRTFEDLEEQVPA